MPDDAVRFRGFGADFEHLGDTRFQRIALFARRVLHADGGVAKHINLPVAPHSGALGVVDRQFVPHHFQFWQFIAFIGKTQVRGFLNEERPTRYPEPEFLFFMSVKRQLVGFG